MGFRAAIAAELTRMYASKGEDALFTPLAGAAVPCKIFLEFNARTAPAGRDESNWQQGTTIKALLSADAVGVGIAREPLRRETFTLIDGAAVYTVQTIIENDGQAVKVVVT